MTSSKTAWGMTGKASKASKVSYFKVLDSYGKYVRAFSTYEGASTFVTMSGRHGSYSIVPVYSKC